MDERMTLPPPEPTQRNLVVGFEERKEKAIVNDPRGRMLQLPLREDLSQPTALSTPSRPPSKIVAQKAPPILPVRKEGISYATFRPYLRPFDLVMFSGADFISNLIKYCEAKGLQNKIPTNYVAPGAFSHLGLIVTSDILSHPSVLPGKIYIWESTMSGVYGEGVTNIDDKSFFGVQLRDFDLLFPVYDRPNDTRVAVAQLVHNPLDGRSTEERLSIRSKFTELFISLNGIRYDYNPLTLFGSLFTRLRCARDTSYAVFGDRWVFCSELVAIVYKRFGIFPLSVKPDNMVPMDFVGYEVDSHRNGGAPMVVSLPPTYIVSDVHDPSHVTKLFEHSRHPFVS